jgi:uncharacterized membrane protein
MIYTYFLGVEAFVIFGYFLGNALFPKRYPAIFYKFFGITVSMLSLWYATMLTGKSWMSLVPYVFVALFVAGIALMIVFRKRLTIPSREFIREFIAIELISLAIYALLVFLRTFKTDILGTEKLMDVALINAITKQGVLPI